MFYVLQVFVIEQYVFDRLLHSYTVVLRVHTDIIFSCGFHRNMSPSSARNTENISLKSIPKPVICVTYYRCDALSLHYDNTALLRDASFLLFQSEY